MKSERRHELQTNELADKLARFIEQVKPYFKLIVGGLIAAIVLLIAMSIMNQQQQERMGKAWSRLFKVTAYNDPQQRDDDARAAALEKVALENPGTLPALWALMTEANLDLETGLRELFTNRDDARDHLDRARKNFERVDKEATRSPLLQQQARFGLAQAYESLGEVSKAKEKYDSVSRVAPESALGKLSAARGKLLGEDEYKNFVEWFQRQKPAAPQGHPGFGGAGGTGLPPLKMDDLPAAPNLNIPGLDLGTDSPKKPEEEKSAAEKPDEVKKEEPAKPEPAKPETSKVEDKKPEPDAAPKVETKSELKTEVQPESKAPAQPASPPADAKKDDAAPAKP